MTSAELLTDAFDRVREEVHAVLDGIAPEQLLHRLDQDANSIAWLIWHLTRVQDDHVSGAANVEQVWTAQGFDAQFALPLSTSDTGYGHTGEQVSSVQVTSPELLASYHDAVHEQTVRFVSQLSDDDLPRIVDRNWDPPVTLGVRLVSVIGDTHQHVGQAAFIRGLLDRRTSTTS